MPLTRIAAPALLAVAVLAVGCSSDDGGGAETTTTTVASQPAGSNDTATTTTASVGNGGVASGTAGTLTLDGETITFDSSLCYLEEQDAAAGGGTIEFVGQAFGTNSAGEEVTIDVSRFSEESQFAGDDVSIVIGDPFSADALEYRSSSPTGTVTVDGGTMRATSVSFLDGESNEVVGSFQFNC
jgi:hypothetical protein